MLLMRGAFEEETKRSEIVRRHIMTGRVELIELGLCLIQSALLRVDREGVEEWRLLDEASISCRRSSDGTSF